MEGDGKFESGDKFPEIRIFESRAENAQKMGDLVAEKLGSYGWTDDEIGNFPVAVIEAAANAILHGNREMPEKKVTVEMSVNAEQAVIKVKDEGEGFDPSAVASPVAEENILKTNGRGIFLLHELCDKLEYEDGGRTAVLAKYKTKPAKEDKS